jgi:TonB family protein
VLRKAAFIWALAFVLGGESFFTFAAQKEEKRGTESEVDEQVYELGKDIIPPRVTKQVNPTYTGSRFRVNGTVSITLVVTSRGVPKDLRVIQSLDPEVDQSAVEAVKQWRFDPAKKDGKVVAVRVVVDIRFNTM